MAQYAEITKIEAPDKAAAGSLVSVTVTIKNLYSETIGIMVDGAVEYGQSPYPGIYFPQEWANVPAYTSHDFAGSFTMPDVNVTLRIRSRYYADGHWMNFDDEKTKNVQVAEPEPEDKWVKLAGTATLTISQITEPEPEPEDKWVKLVGTATLTISQITEPEPEPEDRWIKLVGTANITVKLKDGEGPEEPEPPPDGDEEGKFPWGVALLAAGGAVALAAAIPKRETEGKKTPAKKKG